MLRTSVILVDGMFRESFHAVSFLQAQTLAAEHYEVLWVEYFDRVRPELTAAAAQRDNCRVITLGQKAPYHASTCFNAGISAASGELVVIVDGDLCFDANFLESLVTEHERNDRLACYVQRYNEPRRGDTGSPCLDRLKDVARLNEPYNSGACLSVRKRWLCHINGFDEHPLWASGYHRNDLDVYTRLVAAGLDVLWHPRLRVYHPWHPGTEGVPKQHARHRLVARYRAEQHQTRPFVGLDRADRREPEPELQARLFAQERLWKEEAEGREAGDESGERIQQSE